MPAGPPPTIRQLVEILSIPPIPVGMMLAAGLAQANIADHTGGMRPNRLRELWAAGKPALNCWITLPGTLAAEMLAHQGWDSLTVDMQHGQSDFPSLCAMFAAISTTDTVPLMRVAWNMPGDVMKALDAGAYGVICPNIETVAECE